MQKPIKLGDGATVSCLLVRYVALSLCLIDNLLMKTFVARGGWENERNFLNYVQQNFCWNSPGKRHFATLITENQ